MLSTVAILCPVSGSDQYRSWQLKRLYPTISSARAAFSLVLIWFLVCQLVVPLTYWQVRAAASHDSSLRRTDNDGSSFSRFTRAITAASPGSSTAAPTLAQPDTVTDAVISRGRPALNSGRIEGTLRILQGESFAMNGNTQLTADLYLVGTPTIQVSGSAQHGGIAHDGGAALPNNYTLTLNGSANLPGRIHVGADAVTLPTDFPASVPGPTGTRTVNVQSQSDIATIGNWQTVRNLNVTGSQLTLEVPPGNYGAFTVNGNSRLNFTAGTYNFENTFNLNGSASLQAMGIVTINVTQDLIINSGSLVLGSYTAPADVHLNVLGTTLTVNGGSQVSALVRAYNANVNLNGTSQVRGQVIGNNVTLNGGNVIGAVWPAHSGDSLTTFGPRRFERTKGSPNHYVEQFSLPAGLTAPCTCALRIQNGAPDGSSRVSSAAVKLNGVDLVTASDLNQNVAGLDRTVTLTDQNQLDIRLTSSPGSYLILNITCALTSSDNTPPSVAITAPADQTTTTSSQMNVSGSASDTGPGASGIAHVYVNDVEAVYDVGAETWIFANQPLVLGANQIVARAVDQAGNQNTATINVTREAPPNQPPTVSAGPDQSLTLPRTVSLDGTASDDGLPDGSTLTTTWSTVSGPGDVTFADATAVDTTASFSAEGSYILRLTASDGAASATDDITITVQPENQPPTVAAGPDQTIALPRTAALNGTVTDDGLPTGSTVSVAWSQVSGPGTVSFEDATQAETTASFSLPGTYVLRLTASDHELTATSEVTITVQPENQAPTANAGPDQLVSLPAGAPLNGLAADDGWPAASSVSVTWSFISGPGPVSFDNPNDTVTVARFTIAGVYVLRLTASDGELSGYDELMINVTPPNQAPIVNAGPDQTIALPGTVNLNGTVSDDGLPAGSTLTIQWQMVSGPGSVTFADSSAAQTTATFSTSGTYVLRLTATDSQFTSSDDVEITPPSQPLCQLGDNFDDNAIDLTKWVQPASSSTVVQEVNQRLEISPSLSTTGYNGYISAASCDLTNRRVSVEAVQPTSNVCGGETYFTLRDTTNSGNQIIIVKGCDVLVFYYFVNGVNSSVTLFYNPTEHRFWRLSHNAATNTILWETSPDRVNWTVRRSLLSQFPLTSMATELVAGTYAVVGAGKAIFDELRYEDFSATNGSTISITSPASGAALVSHANINISTNATAPAGPEHQQADFFANFNFLGTASCSPYSPLCPSSANFASPR